MCNGLGTRNARNVGLNLQIELAPNIHCTVVAPTGCVVISNTTGAHDEHVVRQIQLQVEMKFTNRTTLATGQFAELESDLIKHKTLKDVLLWGYQQSNGTMHPHIIADIVIQDEYSHDVIVPWKEGIVLVYGTT